MVAAVFHTPSIRPAGAAAVTAAKPTAKPVSEREPKPPRLPVDWRGISLKVLPPLIGMA